MIGRCDFITLLGGAAAAWPFSAPAQQPAVLLIGYLSSGVAGLFADRKIGPGGSTPWSPDGSLFVSRRSPTSPEASLPLADIPAFGASAASFAEPSAGCKVLITPASLNDFTLPAIVSCSSCSLLRTTVSAFL